MKANTEVVQTPANSVRVMVISDAAPNRNGVGAYYADLLEDLRPYIAAAEIISPEFLSGRWSGGWMLPLPGDKTQKVCLPNAFQLQKKIENFQPTVIVIPTPGLFGLVGALLAKQLNVPIVIGFHTWFEKLASLYWNRLQGEVTKAYFAWVNKALFKLGTRVLANSQEMVNIAARHQAPKPSLMGTPLSRILLHKPLAAVPKRLKSVLFVGRLAAEKNADAVLEAARQHPDMRFTIAGEGPERPRLQRQARLLKNLSFCGWVGREQVVSLIDQHDALVLPSAVESFGTVAMEAMVRQRLVFVSAACGITEWPELRDGLTIVKSNEHLSQSLLAVKRLSEFEIFGRCAVARRVALNHTRWNRSLWLRVLAAQHSSVSSPRIAQPLLQRVMRTLLWR